MGSIDVLMMEVVRPHWGEKICCIATMKIKNTQNNFSSSGDQARAHLLAGLLPQRELLLLLEHEHGPNDAAAAAVAAAAPAATLAPQLPDSKL